MNRQITKRGIILILLLALLLIIGSAAAFMFRQTPAVTNQFDKAVVACEVHEKVNGSNAEYTYGSVTAGTKESITVKNTGNVAAYLRVKIVSHWEDADGNIVAKASVTPEIIRGTDWLSGGNSVYYYKTPVAAGGYTGNLLGSSITLAQSEEGYYQVVEVFAEAIQADPAKAAASSWGIIIDSQGSITGIN